MNELKLWCYLEGDRCYFPVSIILSSQIIYHLQVDLWHEGHVFHSEFDATDSDLILEGAIWSQVM